MSEGVDMNHRPKEPMIDDQASDYQNEVGLILLSQKPRLRSTTHLESTALD